ncbi:MAG: hypothetical protein JSS81_01715 [Acidobacteria bacterium]|nr:hypothetical protein [Acidobacteriota bacterium]
MNKIIPLSLMLLMLIAAPTVRAQSEEDVGDLASFGREAKFFGYAATGTVYVSSDCSVYAPLGPDDRCYPVNAANGTATFDARDLGRIQYPQKTFENVIYILGRNTTSYHLINTSAQNRNGRIQFRPYLTLESDALSDPSLINPLTGQPFNGRVDISLGGLRTFTKTLFPNYQESETFVYGASSVSGITKKYLIDTFGLPAGVADGIFAGKMIIHLNIKGTTTWADDASFSCGARFLGN